jgi:valyl-tRNA synthetase
MLKSASDALMGIRKAKSDQQLSMKAEIASIAIKAPAGKLEELKALEADLRAVGKIDSITFESGEEISIANVSFNPAS